MAHLGFIGLGNMGGPMAANLVKAGHTVKGFDPSAKIGEGIVACSSAAAAASGADVVFTMLPSGQHLLGVYGEESFFDGIPSGGLLIDCSTCDVESSRAAHAMAAGGGLTSLDAPVSGGVGGAAAGTLTFMAGGTTEALERARPFLDIMGSRVIHCGPAGSGQAAKICNNMILGISMIAVSEAFVLGERLGLDPQALFDVASTSSGQCWSLTSYCPEPGPVPTSPANNAYKPGFAAALMLKDLRLSQMAAISAGAQTALGAHAEKLYSKFNDMGHGSDDFSAVIRAIRNGWGEPEDPSTPTH